MVSETAAASLIADLRQKINANPLMLSMLYDLNLLPEQIKDDDMMRWAYVECITGNIEKLQGDVIQLRRELSMHRDKVHGSYWAWQGDGHDFLESLVCPVLIPAAELLEIVNNAKMLETLINTPQTENWFEAVKLEAAHQQTRWGTENDAGKAPADWFWLIGYLAGKSLAAFIKGDVDKGKHHIISTSAALLNWHRHSTGEVTAMRPGIEEPQHG